jgi:DNA-binding IclR family transcriptional regulator
MPPQRSGRVQSVDRALDVLEALGSADHLGVSEVAARTGLVVSTAHRLLAGLADRGYVSQTAAHGHYTLGFKVLKLAGTVQARTAALTALARPHLESIRRATSETTNLVILDRDRVVYVDQVPGLHNVRMFTQVGSSALAHTTASGKAILAHRPADLISELYPPEREPLDSLTSRTKTTVESLRSDFARIRRHGYAIDNEEHEDGVSCVAAPVFGGAVAFSAISISAPTTRIVHADTAELGRLLGRHARELSNLLGDNTASYDSQPATFG